MSSSEELSKQLIKAQEKIKELELNAKTKQNKEIALKVSDKGCVQINGIRKFPITFYRQEFEKIFHMKEEIEEFIEQNASKLSIK